MTAVEKYEMEIGYIADRMIRARMNIRHRATLQGYSSIVFATCGYWYEIMATLPPRNVLEHRSELPRKVVADGSVSYNVEITARIIKNPDTHFVYVVNRLNPYNKDLSGENQPSLYPVQSSVAESVIWSAIADFVVEPFNLRVL